MSRIDKINPCSSFVSFVMGIMVTSKSLMRYVLHHPGKSLVSLLAIQTTLLGVKAERECEFNFKSVVESTVWGVAGGVATGARAGVPAALAGGVIGGLISSVPAVNGELDKMTNCLDKQIRGSGAEPIDMPHDEVQQNSYIAEQYHPQGALM